MSSTSYPFLTPPTPGIGEHYLSIFTSPHCSSTGQARQTVQRPTEQCYAMMSVAPPPVINMTSHSMSKSTIPPNDEFAISENAYHPNTMSLNSRRIVFPGSSSHVVNMSIYATNVNGCVDSSGASNGREAAPIPSSSTHRNYTQFNAATMDNTARPQFPTANSIPYNNNSIPMMPNNAPGPQHNYGHPQATYRNQYYDVPSCNPPSSHGAQYHNTVTGRSYSPAMHPNSNATHSPQYVSPDTDPAPPSSYPYLSYYGAHHGSHPQQGNLAIANSQPAALIVPDQPAPSMASPNLPAASSPPYIDTQDSPITLSCRWRVGDHTCTFEGPLDAFRKHFSSKHLIGAQDSPTKCRWQGCTYRRRARPDVKDMRRDSLLRHVREKHLMMRRGI